jgi:hypothetical protein
VSGASTSSDFFIQRGADAAIKDYVVLHAPEIAGGGVAVMSSGGDVRLLVDTDTGSTVVGINDTSNTRTGNFLFIPTVNTIGDPTNAPAGTYPGRVAIVFNTADNKIYVYDGGWIATAALT